MLGFRLDECFLNYLWASVKIILDVGIEHGDRGLGNLPLLGSADASSVRWLRTLVHGELAWTDDEERHSSLMKMPAVLFGRNRFWLDLNLLGDCW